MKKFWLCALLCASAFSAGRMFCRTASDGKSGTPKGFLYGSVGTGGAMYGSEKIKERQAALKNGSSTRIVIALSGGAALILAEPLYATLALDSILDFHSGGGNYANHLDFSTALGIRAYPAYASTFGGFFVSAEYCLGTRSDIVKMDGDGNSSTPWGNGFRLGAAYDFSRLTKRIAPVVGAAWKRMPRGNGAADNYITVYFGMGFGTRRR